MSNLEWSRASRGRRPIPTGPDTPSVYSTAPTALHNAASRYYLNTIPGYVWSDLTTTEKSELHRILSLEKPANIDTQKLPFLLDILSELLAVHEDNHLLLPSPS